MQRELTLARRQLTLFEAEQQFMSQFLREFPHLTADLHGGVSERGIPGALLNIVLRVLQPRQAVVLLAAVGERSAGLAPDRGRGAPADVAWAQGQRPRLGAAASGRAPAAMDQRDFEYRRRRAVPGLWRIEMDWRPMLSVMRPSACSPSREFRALLRGEGRAAPDRAGRRAGDPLRLGLHAGQGHRRP